MEALFYEEGVEGTGLWLKLKALKQMYFAKLLELLNAKGKSLDQ